MPPNSVDFVIASTNMHKVRELRTMLKPIIKIDLLSLCDFPQYTPPIETGQTFEENAIVKAVHAAKELQRWVIADDSGLIVPALNGAPGVYSARFAGNHATDFDNRKKLLDQMKHLLEEDRNSYYECCIAIASPSGIKKCARGTCEGTLLLQERGAGGFGYDPLFVKHGYSKSFAELPEATKNRISHRRKALDKILLSIDSLLMAELCNRSIT
ncbi:MAG TPA: RdgB/HAM1 family non-canonical purine NTP pyrophosphatase [Chlamydiales bacterium]|nr:RdgB/HAM1 family non-canonical purine NTP pyrophosphatase [Chlamydiales bacterium]